MSTLDTNDTFHTANSNCSLDNGPGTVCLKFLQAHSDCGGHKTSSPMTDSGVSIDTNKKQILLTSTPNRAKSMGQMESDENNTSRSSSSCDNLSADQLSTSQSIQQCSIHKLRKQIAIQKAQIMKLLEINCDKSILDDKIAKLQILQKQYFKQKKITRQSTDEMNLIHSPDRSCCLTDDEYDCSTTTTTSSSDELKSPISTDINMDGPFDGPTRPLPLVGHCRKHFVFILYF